MKLDASSRLVRFAYVLGGSPPERTNLCRFFWRLVGRAMLAALILSAAVGSAVLWIVRPQTAVWAQAIPCGIVLFILWLAWIEERAEKRTKRPPAPEGSIRYVVKEWVKAKKQKVCPIIEIERGGHPVYEWTAKEDA